MTSTPLLVTDDMDALLFPPANIFRRSMLRPKNDFEDSLFPPSTLRSPPDTDMRRDDMPSACVSSKRRRPPDTEAPWLLVDPPGAPSPTRFKPPEMKEAPCAWRATTVTPPSEVVVDSCEALIEASTDFAAKGLTGGLGGGFLRVGRLALLAPGRMARAVTTPGLTCPVPSFCLLGLFSSETEALDELLDSLSECSSSSLDPLRRSLMGRISGMLPTTSKSSEPVEESSRPSFASSSLYAEVVLR